MFLDRDGVINEAQIFDGKPFPPHSLNDFRYLPNVVEGIGRLRNAGYLVIVVTNQPDVSKGTQDKKIVEQMNQKIIEDNLCDDIKVCIHIDEDDCFCRKPKPGMLLQAALQWGIDLKSSAMVGDRWRDVEAGNAAGCITYFIDYKYNEKRPSRPDHIVASLHEAINIILE